MKNMLLKQLIVLPLLLAGLALLHASGMGRASAEAPVRFSNTYVFTVGSSINVPPAAGPAIAGAIAGATPNVKLERVNDSRCRKNTVCVWAGYISYSFSLTNADGTVSNFVLSDNMPNASSKITQNGLTFSLAGVQPEAVPGKNEAAPDYRVSLRVSNTE